MNSYEDVDAWKLAPRSSETFGRNGPNGMPAGSARGCGATFLGAKNTREIS